MIFFPFEGENGNDSEECEIGFVVCIIERVYCIRIFSVVLSFIIYSIVHSLGYPKVCISMVRRRRDFPTPPPELHLMFSTFPSEAIPRFLLVNQTILFAGDQTYVYYSYIHRVCSG